MTIFNQFEPVSGIATVLATAKNRHTDKLFIIEPMMIWSVSTFEGRAEVAAAAGLKPAAAAHKRQREQCRYDYKLLRVKRCAINSCNETPITLLIP